MIIIEDTLKTEIMALDLGAERIEKPAGYDNLKAEEKYELDLFENLSDRHIQIKILKASERTAKNVAFYFWVTMISALVLFGQLVGNLQPADHPDVLADHLMNKGTFGFFFKAIVMDGMTLAFQNMVC